MEALTKLDLSAEMESKERKLLHDLYERVKELKGLYGLYKISEHPDIPDTRLLSEAVRLIPSVWRYSDIACARITYGKKEFKTKSFKETPWIQAAAIKVFGKKEGVVEVFYLKEKPHAHDGHFLKEEKTLINAVAKQLSNTIEKKAMADKLRNLRSELFRQKLELEQKNTALSEVLSHIEAEKNTIKDSIMTNVNEILLPVIQKMRLKTASGKHLAMLEYHLKKIISPFGIKIASKTYNLSPREIEICGMIKGNLSSKEISRFLNLSPQTIEKHRKNIRKKVGISNKKLTLSEYLKSL